MAIRPQRIAKPSLFSFLITLSSQFEALSFLIETVNWIALNTPQYTIADCSILAQYLKGRIIDDYISRRLISGGSVDITTEVGGNFMATGKIEIPKPSALWRVHANLYNTNG
jgi:hypothetical protein